MYSLTIAPNKSIPHFKAGQFLHLALDRYDPASSWPDSRAFSIVTSPARKSSLQITYSVKGRYTERMSREIEEGSEVWIKMPFGQFFVEPSTELETVLIAGGTGITPYISFLELSCDMLLPKGIRLFYGIRSGKYLLYKNTIDKCKLKLEDFNNWLFSESGDELGDMDYIQGRLDIEAIWELTPAPFKSTFYISGPPLMLRNFIRSLHNRGVNPDRVITDDWE